MVHFVIDRASLFTDNSQNNLGKLSPTDFVSSSLKESNGHRCMEYILCRVVESSCLLTHNIAPHISSHDPPYHKTMKKYEDFE